MPVPNEFTGQPTESVSVTDISPIGDAYYVSLKRSSGGSIGAMVDASVLNSYSEFASHVFGVWKFVPILDSASGSQQEAWLATVKNFSDRN